LDRIDWPRAIDAARTARDAAHRLPDLLSLGACFHDDAAVCFAWLDEAARAAPLDPVVALRGAMTRVRFGESGRALAMLEAMPPAVRRMRTVMRAKVVANLHAGEPKRAMNVANELLEQAPDE